MVNLRVKGVKRLEIPGAFKVHLLKDGEKIATSAFFQPRNPKECPTCVKIEDAHFDFELPLEEIRGGKLGVWVEPVDHEPYGDRFPHKLMGNPTVNVRVLLHKN